MQLILLLATVLALALLLLSLAPAVLPGMLEIVMSVVTKSWPLGVDCRHRIQYRVAGFLRAVSQARVRRRIAHQSPLLPAPVLDVDRRKDHGVLNKIVPQPYF